MKTISGSQPQVVQGVCEEVYDKSNKYPILLYDTVIGLPVYAGWLRCKREKKIKGPIFSRKVGTPPSVVI